MQGTLNRVTLIGNLGVAPEVKVTKDNRPVVTLNVATNDNWKDKDGNNQERTQWHRVVVFNEGLCKLAENYLHKGSRLLVEGSLQTRKWQDNNGNDRYATEVVLQGYNAMIKILDKLDTSNTSAQNDNQNIEPDNDEMPF